MVSMESTPVEIARRLPAATTLQRWLVMSPNTDNQRIPDDPGESGIIPPHAMLRSWATYDWRDEISLDNVSPLDQIVVTTLNHTYQIVVLSPATGDVLVRGGSVWPTLTRARLAGSTLGGSLLKVRSLNLGFRLEFILQKGRSVITSRVRSVSVVRGAKDSPDRGIFSGTTAANRQTISH
jgi:hypothetical protein